MRSSGIWAEKLEQFLKNYLNYAVFAVNVALFREEFKIDFNVGGTNLGEDLKERGRAALSNRLSIKFFIKFESHYFEYEKLFFLLLKY